MQLVTLGINHQTAGVQIRERLALEGELSERFIDLLSQRMDGVQSVVLSTCNRTEIYLADDRQQPICIERVQQCWADTCGLTVEQVASSITCREQQAAIGHLFRVSSGLESMVLGEPQILGQVKTAYHNANQRNNVGPTLHRVFQSAIAVGKQVRTITGIDSGRVSVGSIAIEYARQIFERFDDKTVVAIGAGQVAKLTIRHLMGLTPGKLWIVNRSNARANLLVEKLGINPAQGGARPFDQLDKLLTEADIILTGTASTQPIITRNNFASITNRRRHRPVYIIDTAVPRDVDPQVGDLTNVYLYNIDDLQGIASQTHNRRSDHAHQCQSILDQAVTKCMFEIRRREVGHLVRTIRHKLHDFGDTEQQRTLRKLASADIYGDQDALQNVLADHTRRLLNKFLHVPISQLDNEHTEESLLFYTKALRALFDIESDQPTNLIEAASDNHSIDHTEPAQKDDPKVEITIETRRDAELTSLSQRVR